jgi:hypothetical protein
MNLTIRWWMIVIVLVIAPVVYSVFRKPESQWDFQIDTMMVAILCWAFAIGLTIGKLF